MPRLLEYFKMIPNFDNEGQYIAQNHITTYPHDEF